MFLGLIIIILLFICISYNTQEYFTDTVDTSLSSLPVPMSEEQIRLLTDTWINEVTVNKNPDNIYNLFCSDGSLLGTVSQIKRKGTDIKTYFDYFAHLPDLQVLAKEYNIAHVANNVYVNTAFITWNWQGLDNPIVARMTFIYRDRCIFQLHSSKLPQENAKLLEISQKL